MAYSVPDLPYDYNALEPHIGEDTMRVHHDKHHAAYVTNANAALEGTEWADAPVEEVLKSLGSLPADKQAPVRNNAGGHYNHSLFWEWMSPDGGGEPDGALAAAIEAAFGSFSDFQAAFKDAGVKRFGSGWSWLVHDSSGLAVVSTAVVRRVLPWFGIEIARGSRAWTITEGLVGFAILGLGFLLLSTPMVSGWIGSH